ncbi:MAG: guanylate kinase [Cytophagales bacterium]|nr:MAG: guanylate kinase [Cytophagales bacterium]
MKTQGKAIIFSAPSGSGKTTIVKYLLEELNNLSFSISACSREKRNNEIEGQDYYFLTAKDFKKKIDNGEFIEWEEVYTNNYYGTLTTEIERIWNSGKHVIFDVDVKGGLSLKKYFGEKALSIFVKIPDFQILESRLRGRGTDAEEKIIQRLSKAKEEIKFMPLFDIILENNELSITLENSKKIISNFIEEK